MTAVIATFFGFPRLHISSYFAFMSGLNLTATSAAPGWRRSAGLGRVRAIRDYRREGRAQCISDPPECRQTWSAFAGFDQGQRRCTNPSEASQLLEAQALHRPASRIQRPTSASSFFSASSSICRYLTFFSKGSSKTSCAQGILSFTVKSPRLVSIQGPPYRIR